MNFKRAYLGLGSNVGHREAALAQALELLADGDLRIRRLSSLYETAPREITDQPWFLNQVAEIETRLFPPILLARCLRVEQAMGRKRTRRFGPRAIDIDILFYERFVVERPGLSIPHPRLHERRFVLEPMAELEPDFRHPVLRKSIAELREAVRDQEVRLWR
jgi:2-amino-4-hydroxy-6-hydroxymethyldihydropteridine diphosphokinase